MEPLTFTDGQLLAALRTFEETNPQVWQAVQIRAMEQELRERRDDA